MAPILKVWNVSLETTFRVKLHDRAVDILQRVRRELDSAFNDELGDRKYHKVATYSDAVVWLWILSHMLEESQHEEMINYLRTGTI
jgi:hypothetical protein